MSVHVVAAVDHFCTKIAGRREESERFRRIGAGSERLRAAVVRARHDPDSLHVRRSFVAMTVVAAALIAPGAAHAQSTGGAAYSAPSFKVSPATLVAGAPLTLRYRVPGQAERVRVRVDLLAAGGDAPLATLRLGKRRTNKRLKATWTPQ